MWYIDPLRGISLAPLAIDGIVGSLFAYQLTVMHLGVYQAWSHVTSSAIGDRLASAILNLSLLCLALFASCSSAPLQAFGL